MAYESVGNLMGIRRDDCKIRVSLTPSKTNSMCVDRNVESLGYFFISRPSTVVNQ